MIDTLIILTAGAWFIWKFIKGKNPRHLHIAILVLMLQLSRWPFFAPIKFSFALMAFSCAGFLLYENYYKKKDTNVLLFVVVLGGFGLTFLADLVYR